MTGDQAAAYFDDEGNYAKAFMRWQSDHIADPLSEYKLEDGTIDLQRMHQDFRTRVWDAMRRQQAAVAQPGQVGGAGNDIDLDDLDL